MPNEFADELVAVAFMERWRDNKSAEPSRALRYADKGRQDRRKPASQAAGGQVPGGADQASVLTPELEYRTLLTQATRFGKHILPYVEV
jgi:hypothetical protein